MATTHSYLFHNTDRIGSDATDNSQRTLSNTRFTNYTLSNYFSQNLSAGHVDFATAQPTMMVGGTVHGHGLGAGSVDAESNILLKMVDERPHEKLQLMPRPFVTVPYLGRGSCDPTLESQLQQGEIVSDKKSVSTIMDKSFSKYALYPTDDNMEERVKDSRYTVEEAAMDGWVRGGTSTRELSNDEYLKKNNRPNGAF